ncbi:hypothetical protein Tco_0386158 [Tanacetum coccineum]
MCSFREQRKHDKKVCCLGLTSLLTLPSDQLPERHRRSLKDDDGHGSWWREADSLRLQRLAAQAKSFRPADDDDDDFSDAWNYI